MPAVFDINNAFFVDIRADITVAFRHQRQGGKCIQPRHCLCRALNPVHLRCNLIPDAAVQLIFQSIQFVFCSENHILQLFQLRSNIAFRIGQRLFSCIVIRHHRLVGIGHFQIIAEHLVIFYFQIFDSCFFPLFIFQFCQPVFSVGLGSSELVDLLIIAVPDNISLFHGNGRFVPDRAFQQAAQILQRIHILINLFQQIRLHFLKQIPDGRQHFQRSFKRSQIPRIGCPICNLRKQTFQIINRRQILPDFLSGNRLIFQFFHGIQPKYNFFFINQRLLYTFSQHPGPHSCFCLIQNPEQGASLLFFTQSLTQLQISPGGAVQKHIFSRYIRRNMRQIGKRVLLGLQKILKERAGTDNAAVIILQPQAAETGYVKMFQQLFSAQRIVKIPGLQRINGNAQPVFQAVQVHSAHIKSFIADNFRRHESADLVHQPGAVRQLRHQIFSGGNIRDRNTVPVRNIDNTHNIIIFRLIQSLRIYVCTGGNNPHNFPFYNSFGLLRVFRLFTDSHLISPGYKFIEIPFHGMIRNAAHGRPLLLPAVFSCQGNFQFPGCSQRIIKKHLVKIA